MPDTTILGGLLGTENEKEQVRKVAALLKPSIILLLTKHPEQGVAVSVSAMPSGSQINTEDLYGILDEVRRLIMKREMEEYASQIIAQNAKAAPAKTEETF